VELENDYADIASTVTALAVCGDATLVPRLCEVLDRFLDKENFYGRDLIAGVLAGIQGAAALPVLLRASVRDLGDDRDGLQSEIVELLHADREVGRRTPASLDGSCLPDSIRRSSGYMDSRQGETAEPPGNLTTGGDFGSARLLACRGR
jgi:hypothetical protein